MSWSTLLPASMFSLKNFPYKSISCCATPVVASTQVIDVWSAVRKSQAAADSCVRSCCFLSKTLEVTISYMRESPWSTKLPRNAVCRCLDSLRDCIVEIFHRLVCYFCWTGNTRFMITSWVLGNYGCLLSGTPVHISKQIYHSVVVLRLMITFTTINLV